MQAIIIWICVLVAGRLCHGQAILTQMEKDPSVSQFYKLIKSNPTFISYFNYDYICVFAPSNDAMTAANVAAADEDAFIKRHTFKSMLGDSTGLKAVVASWSQYLSFPTKTDTIYFSASLQGSPIFMLPSQTPKPLVNGASVISPDCVAQNQVYHVVNRSFPIGSDQDFMQTIKADPNLSTSHNMWKKLEDAFNANQLNGVSFFNTNILHLSTSFGGTFLVPTNQAWAAVPPAIYASLNDPNQLNNVMARLYIPYRMVVAHEQTITFMAGFAQDPKVDSSSNIPGRYFHDRQVGDTVTVQGCSSTILLANIPFRTGLLHVLNSAMVVPDSPASYLQSRAPSFYGEVAKDPVLMALFNNSNTVLAPNEQSMVAIMQMDAVSKQQALMNYFLGGLQTLSSLNNSAVTTLGNTSIYIHGEGQYIYVDSVASSSEKTYYNRARVTRADQALPGANINIINGTIGTVLQNCSTMLQILDLGAYQSLVDSIPIPIGKGSPYTMFVPNNAAISSLTGVTVVTRPSYPTPATPPSPGPAAPASTVTTTANPNITTASSTMPSTLSSLSSNQPGSSTAAGPPIYSQQYIRYILQRMIIANRLVLYTKTSGPFKAATMNYAATQEMLSMIITGGSVSVGLNGVAFDRQTLDWGFYCTSNGPTTTDDRRNLIYEVSWVLSTPNDNLANPCVTPPCRGCVVAWGWTLVLGLASGLLYGRG